MNKELAQSTYEHEDTHFPLCPQLRISFVTSSQLFLYLQPKPSVSSARPEKNGSLNMASCPPPTHCLQKLSLLSARKTAPLRTSALMCRPLSQVALTAFSPSWVKPSVFTWAHQLSSGIVPVVLSHTRAPLRQSEGPWDYTGPTSRSGP